MPGNPRTRPNSFPGSWFGIRRFLTNTKPWNLRSISNRTPAEPLRKRDSCIALRISQLLLPSVALAEKSSTGPDASGDRRSAIADRGLYHAAINLDQSGDRTVSASPGAYPDFGE